MNDDQKLIYGEVSEDELASLNIDLSKKTAIEILEWSVQAYGKDLFYPCSFGLEGVVLIDMISKIQENIKIVFLDTDFHFKETYDLIKEVQHRYPKLDIEILKPEITPEQQAKNYGEKLWEVNPDQCCHIRKVKPLQEKMGMYKAWITGIRRKQSPYRAQMNAINFDHVFQRMKICPLIDWSLDEVWSYVRMNNLPFNPLHKQGYPSIGCEYCTSKGNGDTREGRWKGAEKNECGLHSRLGGLPKEGS
ncbi:MAG: phosphoadenylyl-sulfate reductase [Bacillota bacterium]